MTNIELNKSPRLYPNKVTNASEDGLINGKMISKTATVNPSIGLFKLDDFTVDSPSSPD